MRYKAWLTIDAHQILALNLFPSHEKCKKTGLNPSVDQNIVPKNYAIQSPHTNHTKLKVLLCQNQDSSNGEREVFLYTSVISKFL